MLPGPDCEGSLLPTHSMSDAGAEHASLNRLSSHDIEARENFKSGLTSTLFGGMDIQDAAPKGGFKRPSGAKAADANRVNCRKIRGDGQPAAKAGIVKHLLREVGKVQRLGSARKQ